MQGFSDAEKSYILTDSAALSYAKKSALHRLFPDKRALLEAVSARSGKVSAIAKEQSAALFESAKLVQFEKFLDALTRAGVTPVTMASQDYPDRLMRLKEPPHVLYCKGNIKLLASDCVSVVGSRRCTVRACRVVKQLSMSLAPHLTVVSGLAEGADAAAHQGALECGGNTIAVIAGGIGHVYPASNAWLYREIEKKGLIISESPPGTRPFPASFLIRNRIIAALGQGTVITFAGLRSGTRVTAEYALDCGSELMVLPGGIDSRESEGCNHMIRELQGAAVLGADDILRRLGKLPQSAAKKQPAQLAADTDYTAVTQTGTDKKAVYGKTYTEPTSAEHILSAHKDVSDTCAGDEIQAPLQNEKANAPKSATQTAGETSPQPAPQTDDISAESQLLCGFLKSPKHFQQICAHIKQSAADTLALLLREEIAGRIKRLPGNMYTAAAHGT